MITPRPINMRSVMPATAALIDAFRAEFGVDEVSASVRRGMKGEAGMFWSSEAGHEVGTRDPREGVIPASVKPVVIGRAGK
jgi:hypothetical protein